MSEETRTQTPRRAINFDLSTRTLEEIFGKGNTAKPYSDITHFMKENGFIHRQYSGYVSKEPMSDREFIKIY